MKNKIIKDICKTVGVRIHHKNIKSFSGQAKLPERIIEISTKFIKSRREYLSTFFHELGHFYCYDNDIYPIFHGKRDFNSILDEFKAMKLTALRAEKFVDKWAAKIMRKYFPKIRFVHAYNSYHDRNWLKTKLEKHYKNFL